MVNAGEKFIVSLNIEKEIPLSNTTEHHIEWIELDFHPENCKFPFMVGKFDFAGHGASVKGAKEGTLFTKLKVTIASKVRNSGTLTAMSF